MKGPGRYFFIWGAVLLIVLLVPLGWGQGNGWHYNAGGRLLGVKSRGNNIWVVGAQGLILHSTDSGNTWSTRESGTTVDLHGVSFPDDSNGWAVGGDAGTCYVLRTRDGGISWNTQQIIPLTWLWGVCFVDTLHGWACGAIDTILKSTDGGVTWAKLPMNQLNHGTSVSFIDTMNGWVTIDPGISAILKTTNGGQSWSMRTGVGGELGDLDMLDSLRGWASGSGTIIKTTDGWESWTRQYTGPGYLYGISVGDSLTSWSAGSHRIIATTSNSGNTWSIDSTKTRDNTFYGVDGHLQLNNVTVVGDAGAIIRSTNAGSTWRVIRNVDIGNTSLTNVAFYDPNQGWAVGTYGVITHTTNGGTVWSLQNSGTQNFLNGVAFPTNQNGWVCSWNGDILTTADAGSNWAPQTSNTSLPLFSIEFLSNDTLYGWAVGGNYVKEPPIVVGQGSKGAGEHGGQGDKEIRRQGAEKDTLKPWGTGLDFWKWLWRPEEVTLQTPNRVITRTTNGGALWIAQNTSGDVPLYGVSFVTRAEGWACGDPQGGMGVILHTTDTGATWTGQSSTVNQSLFWIQFRGNQTGWCVGSGGTALWTTDGGVTWNQGNTGITASLWSCAFYDTLNGFACGNNGLVIQTTDGGRNWAVDTTHVYANLMAVNALDSLHAWTVGSYGMVLGWKEGGVYGVEESGQTAKWSTGKMIRLEQSYPNPMRGDCAIGYWLNDKGQGVKPSSGQTIELKIYDISGRTVRRFEGSTVGQSTAGRHTVIWDGKDEAGKNVPAGVYFYQLRTNELTETKKLIKIQ